MKYFKKSDVIFLSILGAVLIVFTVFLYSNSAKDVDVLEIIVGSETYATYPLNKDIVIEIDEFGHNVAEIKDGVVRMIDADCPDGLCLAQSPLESGFGIIACLPNGVLLTVDTNIKTSNNSVDSVS